MGYKTFGNFEVDTETKKIWNLYQDNVTCDPKDFDDLLEAIKFAKCGGQENGLD